MTLNEQDLLERYEALGDEADFEAAKVAFERALAAGPDAPTLLGYGYLLECHARGELRRAVELYRQAIELDPTADKPVFQLIAAYGGLREPESAVAYCEARFASGELREHRFLGTAYLQAGDHAAAGRVIDAGLALAPDDAALTSLRGELRAATGDHDGALADWRRALELDGDDIAPLYSSAFLLERAGRLDEAAEAWRSIVAWNEDRGFALQSRWPKAELARLGTVGA
jgi:tetratricopeptide (TPR) repeat protein